MSRHSRRLCFALKTGHRGWLRSFGDCVREQVAGGGALRDYLTAAAVLVPVPGTHSAASGFPWAAWDLACELRRRGLAAHVWPALSRGGALLSSSGAWRGRRPTVAEHCGALSPGTAAPFALAMSAHQPEVILVDDVVSRGRTLLAAALCLREQQPGIAIRAFALFRTMGLVGELTRLVDPCRGVICWTGADTIRDP